MTRYIYLLLLILPFAAQAQMLYPKDFIRLLQCDTSKQCFEKIVMATDYYFLGEFDAVPREDIEAQTDKDSIFMSLCRQKALTYIYESNFMYPVAIGRSVRTPDRYHYQYCEQYNQVTYWTSADMYLDIFIEKAMAGGFAADSMPASYPRNYADKYFRFSDSLCSYHLFVKSYDMGKTHEGRKIPYPRFQVRMRRERK